MLLIFLYFIMVFSYGLFFTYISSKCMSGDCRRNQENAQEDHANLTEQVSIVLLSWQINTTGWHWCVELYVVFGDERKAISITQQEGGPATSEDQFKSMLDCRTCPYTSAWVDVMQSMGLGLQLLINKV